MTKTEFLENLQADSNDNHRLLLWCALNVTDGNVVEFGSGWGSTSYLREYCKQSGRSFETYDNGEEWAKLHKSTFVPDNNWESINPKGSVILIDHAPGEQRHIDIKRLVDNFDIFVVHDTEPFGQGDYRYNNIFPLFKYRIDIKSTNLWATALSNTIDVSIFEGEAFGKYIVGG